MRPFDETTPGPGTPVYAFLKDKRLHLGGSVHDEVPQVSSRTIGSRFRLAHSPEQPHFAAHGDRGPIAFGVPCQKGRFPTRKPQPSGTSCRLIQAALEKDRFRRRVRCQKLGTPARNPIV